MNRREAFGQVIRALRLDAGLTQPQLAERLEDVQGLKQADISKIENGKHKSPEMHLAALADALGVRPGEITTRTDDLLEGATAAPSTKPPKVPMPQVVPIVGWVRAGQWDQVENPFDPDIAEGTAATGAKVGSRAYALRVKGDSMTNPAGWPSFPEGTTIIVDPTRQPVSGDLVIAQVDEDLEATFKRLVMDAGTTFLVPLNPRYPTIMVDRPVRICGVVASSAERTVF